MCKYCDWLYEDDAAPIDMIKSELKFHKLADVEVPFGVYLGTKQLRSRGEERKASINLYLGECFDSVGELEVNFCPVCGKELKDLPEL